MNPNLPADLYPYATADGKSIPLECLRPQGLTIKALTENSSSFTLPEDSETVLLYCTKDCILRFGAASASPADGVYEANSLFLPKGHSMSVLIPDNEIHAKLLAVGTGTLFVQTLVKWAGLAIDTNYIRR